MTPQTRPGQGARLSRRAALRLGAGAIAGLSAAGALAGCTLNNPLSDEETPAAEAVRDLAPDVAIAVEAVRLVRVTQAAVTSTAGQHPALGTRLSGLLATHRAHLDALVDAVPKGVDTSAGGPAYVVPARPKAAVTSLVAVERTLHDSLIGLAMRARSGPFARLLGSMAAALSQQVRGLSA